MSETNTERSYSDHSPGQRKSFVGTVIPNKMSKTASVHIERTERHRKYKKYIRRHSKIYAHDPKEMAQVGDLVRIVECRPFSKLKRFYVAEVIKKAKEG